MKKLPKILLYVRLFLGLIIILLSIIQIQDYKLIAVIFLTLGLLTDIFDGIIARRLNISDQKLRRLDSNIDQIFFLSFTVATYIQCPDFFKNNWLALTILIGIESLTYLLSFIKFKKEIATHSIGAKIWTLVLFVTLVQLIIQCKSVILFDICFWTGILTRLEIIAIILILKKWTNDVPTIYHAIKLRQGKAIKRSKIFNG